MNNIDFTSPQFLIAAAVALLLIIGAIAIAADQRKKRSARLRSRFGSEYELAVQETGSTKAAEQALRARVSRMSGLRLHDLSEIERERYLAQWEAIESRFIDHPRGAVTEADELVNSILSTRGYPAGTFAQRVTDFSVHHGSLAGLYRRANAITVRAGKNEATTEELRGTMLQYREIVDALLGTPAAAGDATAFSQNRALA